MLFTWQYLDLNQAISQFCCACKLSDAGQRIIVECRPRCRKCTTLKTVASYPLHFQSQAHSTLPRRLCSLSTSSAISTRPARLLEVAEKYIVRLATVPDCLLGKGAHLSCRRCRQSSVTALLLVLGTEIKLVLVEKTVKFLTTSYKDKFLSL